MNLKQQTHTITAISVITFGIAFYYFLPHDFLTPPKYPFVFSFLATVILCIILAGLNYWNQNTPEYSAEFRNFQFSYLSVYFCMSFGDWLQGPYVYALYASYGYTIGDIGILFILGFGSSLVFGTFIGSISDKVGRKKICILYGVFYIFSCLTKHFPNFYILVLGRISGGIATSILNSAFESWMISEHFGRGYSNELLDYTFYLQVFGNGIIAILAGLLGTFVKTLFESTIAPFDSAILFLLTGIILIQIYWTENYGDSESDSSILQGFQDGFYAMKNDPKIIFLGISQSFFEAAMYAFVFMWTPVLEKYYPNLPHGLIFATFMVSVMIGSSIYKSLSDYFIEFVVAAIFGISAFSLSFPILIHDGSVILTGFIIFEAMVGMFWPSVGMLRSKYIPENVRSTIMNYFRIPTNLFVMIVLGRVDSMTHTQVFIICVLLLLTCYGVQCYLAYNQYKHQKADLDIQKETSNDGITLDQQTDDII
eukprot:gene5864-9692_t